MCRSSAKSIGFLLLLWIGIFIPVSEYQISHFTGSVDVGGVLHTFGDDSADTLSQDADAHDHVGSSASADLSDFTLAPQPPQVLLPGNSIVLRRRAVGFTSRELAPQERPPIRFAV